MRILHLVDDHPTCAWPAVYANIADSIDRHHIQESESEREAEHAVAMIGSSRARRLAESVGLRIDHRFSRQTAPIARPSNRQFQSWLHKHGFDYVYAWSQSVRAHPIARHAKRLKYRNANAPPYCLHTSRIVHKNDLDHVHDHDLDHDLALPLGHDLDLGPDQDATHPTRATHATNPTRAALRSSWGITPDNDAVTKVVALLSDPPAGPNSASVDHAALALSMAADSISIGNKNVALAVTPTAKHRLRAERTARARGCPNRVIQAPELLRPWHGLVGCDATICFNPDEYGAGVYSAWARAVGLPIITPSPYPQPSSPPSSPPLSASNHTSASTGPRDLAEHILAYLNA